MSEELLQRNLLKNPEKIGKWDFYNIGATSVKALKENNIIHNIDYGKEEAKKVDGLLVQNKKVVAVIEFKTPKEFNTAAKKRKAIKQELIVAKKLKASILIATDTQESIWVNVLTGNIVKDEEGNEVDFLFDPQNEKLPDLIEKISYSVNELNDQLKPKNLVNPTDLAKQIWQDIWSVSGATPENCLYTFVELFIFKYLSDLGVLKGIYSFDNLYNNYEDNDEGEVLELYASTIRPKIKELFPENTLDKTTIINGTIFVSKDQKAVSGYSTVFKKVLKKFKDYGRLEHIDRDFKSQLFESFLKESISKKNWGQFFTPLKVVRAIAEIAKDEIKVGARICDPACGVGKFLLEPIITKLDEFYTVEKGKLKPKIYLEGFDKGFDKDEQKTIILAKANMLIYFSDLIKENPNITKEFSKVFNDSFLLKTNSILGTLSEPVENKYDLILTNPPYVTSGSSNLKEEIKKDGDLTSYYKVNGMGVEGLFMEWIVKSLKPNGKAFVVVPDGIFNRINDKSLRKFIKDECYIDGIISLPTKTFFTTPKKTYILCVTKKAKTSDVQTDPVFTYLVSEIGEGRDIYRFDIDQDDLTEAITLYSFFKGNKSNFEAINTAERCKIQPFERFDPEDHWCVDRWWSTSEKEDLGLLEEGLKIKFQEFPNFLETAKDTIDSFKEEVQELSSESDTVSFTKFKLGDIFDLKKRTNHSKFTKAFINKNQGEIPVFSASKFSDNADYGYVKDNLPSIKYFEDCLTWNIDGSVGKAHYREGRFSLSEKVIPLIVKNEYQNKLDPIYLKYMIESEYGGYYFGFDNKAGKSRIKDIELPIPVNKNNDFDLVAQKNISEKYKRLEEIQKSIADEFDKISKTKIEVG